MTNELKHYGVIGMKWGTIPSPEHVTKEHVNYLKDTFKQQRTVKGRIGQVLNEGSKLIRKRK